jgi:hypothetical protein
VQANVSAQAKTGVKQKLLFRFHGGHALFGILTVALLDTSLATDDFRKDYQQ